MSATDVAPRRLPAVDISDAALARVTEALASTAERYDRSAEFPWEPIGVVHDAGLLRFGIGSRYGGQDVTVADTARVLQALGRGDASVALISAMTIAMHVAQSRTRWWPEELYERVVADSLERPVLINAVRAEPELGAPARGGIPATKLRRTERGWVVTGRKAYATSSEGLAYHLVWAATEEEDPLLGHVIVPGDDPGIEIIHTWDHLGMRASSTHDVVYHDIEVPAANFAGVRASEQGAAGIDRSLIGLWVVVSALYVGVARAAQSFFVGFAHDRVPAGLGRPIATTERIQTVAGEIEAQLIAAEQVLYGIAARIDAGDPDAPRLAPAGKLLATRGAVAAVQAAVAALGNPALSRSNPLERHLRDVLCCRIHPPQDDSALIVLGRGSLARR